MCNRGNAATLDPSANTRHMTFALVRLHAVVPAVATQEPKWSDTTDSQFVDPIVESFGPPITTSGDTGEQAMVEISPLRDVLISLLANLAAWAVGVFIAYFSHDLDPDFMDATLQHKSASRAYYRSRHRTDNISRSSSPNTHPIWIMALPNGLVESIARRSLYRATPAASNSAMALATLGRSCRAVDRPAHAHVEPASHGVLEHLVERRPPVPRLGADDAGVLVRMDDRPPSAVGPAIDSYRVGPSNRRLTNLAYIFLWLPTNRDGPGSAANMAKGKPGKRIVPVEGRLRRYEGAFGAVSL